MGEGEATDIGYTFEVSPARREAAFFYSLLIAFPVVAFRFLLSPSRTADKVMYVLFSPFLILRNLWHLFFCAFPFLPDVAYRLTLHKTHISFGMDDERLQFANSYGVIVGTFALSKGWIALLRDGYIIYLPPGGDGSSAAEVIEQARRDSLPVLSA